MTACAASSEPLADLVRSMLTAPKQPSKPAVKAAPSPPRSEQPEFPALKTVPHVQESYWKVAVPAAAVAVLSYLLMLAV